MRYLLGFVCVLALGVAFVACGGQEGGCAEPVDVSGEWQMTSTVVSDNCDGRENQTFPMAITQDGNALTAETSELTFAGTICGNQIRMDGGFPDEGGTTTVNATLVVSTDGNSMEGSDNWTWTDGAESCSGSDSLSGTRTDDCGEPLDVAGEWLLTATPIEDTCGGDLAPYMFPVTIAQDGNALAGQAYGEALPGTICGNQIRMSGRFSDYGQTTTVDIQLTVSADENSLEGSDTWTWTDGVESCGGSESLSGIRVDAPPGWTCPREYYGTADGCDCGCGVLDPDCFDGTVSSCEFCDGPGSCSFFSCPGDIDPAQNWLCDGEPAVCGDDIAQPPEICDGSDLGLLTGLTCVDFGFTGGTWACNATCNNIDLTGCAGGPPGWTCPPDFYGTGDGCDCGCGVLDPDCADGTVASCEFCDGPGSCSGVDSFCRDIDPAQNWLCQGAGGNGGTGGADGAGGAGGG